MEFYWIVSFWRVLRGEGRRMVIVGLWSVGMWCRLYVGVKVSF